METPWDGSQPASSLPVRPAKRAAVVRECAQRLLSEARLDDDTRVRIEGAMRACDMMGAGATTLPNVSQRQILNAAARDVARTWTDIYGAPPWRDRPLFLRWLDR